MTAAGGTPHPQGEPAGRGPANPTAIAALLATAAAVGGFLFGFDSSVINGAVDAIEGDFGLSAFVVGFVVSSALLGCAAGAWFAGPLGDRIGRVRVMLITSALFLISAIGSALSFGAADLIVWRLVGGLAIGAASVIAPAYIAEIAPARMRGRLGSLQQMAIVLGIFAALVADYLIARVSDGGASGEFPLGGTAWRWMFASELVPAVLYGVIALVIPESPRYLVKKRQPERAREVLRRVMDPSEVDAKVEEISRSLAEDRPVRLGDLRGPRLGLLPIVWVGLLLSVFQQFVGINVIFYYSTSLWQSVGFSEGDAMLTSVINSLVNVAFTLVAIALIDRIGRRPLLLGGAAGMALSLGTLAVCFATAPVVDGEPALGDVAGPVALVAANTFVASFAATWGPVVWVMLGEMFNNFIRASALAVAASAQWIANFVITTTFPAVSGVSLGLAYGMYTAFSVLAIIFVLRAVPETKGRELEDMDSLTSPRARA
ncbi:sugar porter family MFS transporter [Actinomadura livida]|uniref:Sugar porter (SP) family MFS transporter n=1 Tax=Actinomadura livida TaxID=79909 RepID=A0A7W7IEN7_9ACTN|nr:MULTISPECIES: sugar porter family MFS transporter [Actinomadura]MBB4775707.1 sugar porter (SP) family MFS transporter [Actinomadura catellatispora]GGU34556.1 MFS transporter [Actinomadura livida]